MLIQPQGAYFIDMQREATPIKPQVFWTTTFMNLVSLGASLYPSAKTYKPK